MTTENEATCVGCGCTDSEACDDGMLGSCYWITVDRKAGVGVCSECPEALQRWKEGDRTPRIAHG